MIGSGFCSNCDNWHAALRLTGKTIEASDGGTDWQVAPGTICECGQLLTWLHEPPLTYFIVTKSGHDGVIQDKQTNGPTMSKKPRRFLAAAIAAFAMLIMLACGIDDVTMNYDWQTATVEAAIVKGDGR